MKLDIYWLAILTMSKIKTFHSTKCFDLRVTHTRLSIEQIYTDFDSYCPMLIGPHERGSVTHSLRLQA